MVTQDRLRIEAGTWVVICDGRKALVLANRGDAMFPNLRTVEVHEQDNPRSSEQGSDAPGRVHASVGAARSAVETTDWHAEAERAFLRGVALRLEAALAAGETRHLIVVAPPHALGQLRTLYPRAVQAALAAEIDRDLVRLPIHEIERHLVG
ncbi:baeRF12 domain-containing protein [Ancylobacter terrae]|uniref:baeRF12 domain-containing protein n=1 Tax=Ancylobacter sp. sgz301288 TaxID=3342077 RepID=UPI00385CD557